MMFTVNQYGVECDVDHTPVLIIDRRFSLTLLSLSVSCDVKHTCQCSEECTGMESHSTKPRHKVWRRVAKRARRKQLRQRAAQEREAVEDRLRAALECNADYLKYRDEQERREAERELREQEEHVERERLWLEEEARAQKEWQTVQERKEISRQQHLEQQIKIREEFEAKQEAIRKKNEEEQRKHEEHLRRQEQLQKEINDYIDNGMKTPEPLREVINSQPSKDPCPFFTKTGACRYGDACSKNHRKVFLSKVILISGFYSHFSLEKNSAEYDTDVTLEFENSETRHHFHEFYKDVIDELELYGRINTFRCCCNSEVHLRGNVYIEYYTEREAARAWRSLKGRWYAGKQLNCEFANVTSWRRAICGMSKCPKGRGCNFLHVFKNPHDEYGIKSPPRWTKDITQDSDNSKRSEHKNRSEWREYVRDNDDDARNWRWSESPEIELDHRTKIAEKRRSHSTERDRSRRSSRNERHEKNEKSSERSSKSTRLSKRRRQSSYEIKEHNDEIEDDEAVPDNRFSKKRKKKSKRRGDKKYL